MPAIHTFKIPNPFVEGRNRVYLLMDEPVTLIDSGIATDRAFEELVDEMRKVGVQPGDIQRILLTHKHIDHIGNAWRIQRESGAEIHIHKSELAAINDVDPTGDRYAGLINERFDEWQVPRDARPSKKETTHPGWTIESADVLPLEHEQTLPMGSGSFEVLHTPGHTAGSICLRLGDRLFVGDHILPDISPNVGGGDLRHRGLLAHYLRSLTCSQSDSAGCHVMPGHGDPMASGPDRCRDLIRHHEDRLEKLVDILGQSGPSTVFETARALFGEMKSFHVILGCAEAHAHLEVLVERELVAETDGRFAT